MSMKKIIQLYFSVSVGFALLMGTFAVAQQTPAALQSVDHCATMEQDSILRRRFPQMGTLDAFERSLQTKIVDIKQREKSGRTQAVVLSIPVVVHIVHNGEAVGQGRNLSAAQVQAQLDVLNEDFRRKPGTPGFNTSPVGADIEIEFCLAVKDQQGRDIAEPGIHRYRGERADWTRDQIEGELKPRTIWTPTKYYNIWVLDFASADERLLGYAQFPSQSTLQGLPSDGGPASTDGVVITYTSFGAARKGSFPVMRPPYNQGRTLTHETGHWLGLRHIWGDASCGEDFCADTPPQPSESRGCDAGRLSCDNRTPAMVQNYMDYSDDGCMNIFTRDQKTRMRAVMEISPRRRELVSANVCGIQVVAVPQADFRSNRQRVLKGASVQFTDLSTNGPSTWKWTFEGGTPSTDSVQNPVVQYNTAGVFDVTLVASNRFGASAPRVRTDYIEVLDAGLCNALTNFRQSTDTTKPGTPTLIRLAQPLQGYSSGHNSLKHRAKSEYFNNDLGYTNLSGASLRFGAAFAKMGAATESTVSVLVWNARGFQNGPGAVLERKEVPLRVILEDVKNGVPTNVTFDRNVPIAEAPFHVGIQLDYQGDTVALITTRDGEWTFGTAWEQDSTGTWDRYTTARGQNVAHAIAPVVGVKSSVQVSTSTLFVDAGQSVTLNARGASILSWQSPNNDLNTTLGPQVVVQPFETTTYTVSGGGDDLCNASARITVYVRNPTAVSPEVLDKQLTVYPNPSAGTFLLDVTNSLTGAVHITVHNAVGRRLFAEETTKMSEAFSRTLDLSALPGGVYFVEFTLGELKVRKKIVKL